MEEPKKKKGAAAKKTAKKKVAKPKNAKKSKTKRASKKTGPAKAKGGNMMPALIAIAVMVLVATGAFFLINKYYPDGEQQGPSAVETIGDAVKDAVDTKEAEASRFASYNETKVDAEPSVPVYSVGENLANVTNADSFEFSEDAERLLVENSFVVIPDDYKEFFSIYENNRYAEVPNFVTTDSVLHNYHLMFSHLLKSIEEKELIDELKSLTESMAEDSMEQYEELEGTEWENAARRNVGFFSVAGRLLDDDFEAPEMVQDLVEAELELIEAREGIAVSPLMNAGVETDPVEALKEDYSQYIPRGHYDKTEELKQYFKAMMWYGRMTFRFKEADEARSAILATLAIEEGNRDSWERIYEPTNFFVGKSDDVSYYQVSDAVEEVYGDLPEASELSADESLFSRAHQALKELDPPQINSIPIFEDTIQPDRDKEILGFRFMGQRFTVDANIFQRLIDREVPDRMLPKGLDITAAMGSDEALDILDDMGETDYENYSDNMSKLRKYISDLSQETWIQNLYWGWMHSLRPLLAEKGDGYPMFMKNNAWVRKELNTFLASWTELKHDTILYAKQVYAELGGAPEEPDVKGYVEPNPELYARIASLLAMTREGLELRDLLDSRDSETLERMERLVRDLLVISEKELENIPLNDDEYELIRTYGGQLEHFWIEALRDEGVQSISQLHDNPAALVADVATDPNGQVLEEATGWINSIYVVAPIEGELRLTKGAVYSYYEFTQPISERLTDSEWQEMLESDAPDLPEWTSVFMGEPAN